MPMYANVCQLRFIQSFTTYHILTRFYLGNVRDKDIIHVIRALENIRNASKIEVELSSFSSKSALNFQKLIPIWSMDTHILNIAVITMRLYK